MSVAQLEIRLMVLQISIRSGVFILNSRFSNLENYRIIRQADLDLDSDNAMTEATISKLNNLVLVYKKLIKLLRASREMQLTALADSAARSLAQLEERHTGEVDPKTDREILRGLEQGLREMPKLLASIIPRSHLEFVSELEEKLGCKFSDF